MVNLKPQLISWDKGVQWGPLPTSAAPHGPGTLHLAPAGVCCLSSKNQCTSWGAFLDSP